MEKMKIIVPIVVIVLIIGVVAGYFLFYADDDEEEEEEELFELTINIEGEGSVDVDPDQDEYEEDTEVELEAIADEGWFFDQWTGDASGTDTTITVTMDEDKSITANFDTDETTYELTINIDGDGSTEPAEGTHSYLEGENVTVEATPAEGYEFVEWTGDETGTETTITVTMDDDKTITAVFEEEDEDEEDDETYWNAYDFESEVDVQEEALQSFLAANDDGNKTLQEWTYDHTFVDEDGQHMNFTIETSYEGVSEDTEITVMRYDISDPMDPVEEEVTATIQTYELEHHIDVEIEGDETHPDWIEMTVHIPVGNFSTEGVDTPMGYDDVSNFWIYSKVEFTDANDNEGLFSYHLTEDWEDEMDEDDDIYYVPYMEGDFDDTDYDEWVLYGIYGHCWTWFQPFSEDIPIEEGDHTIDIGEIDFSFYVESTTVDLSGYTFGGFTIGSEDVTFGEEDVHLEGTFVPSLPIPVYLRAGQEDGDTSYTMELTDIVLE